MKPVSTCFTPAPWPPAWLQAAKQPAAPSEDPAPTQDQEPATDPEVVEWVAPIVPADIKVDGWDSAVPIETVTPCPTCGRLEVWWDGMGRQHCLRCDPPRTSARLLRQAAQIRRQAASRAQAAG